MENTTLLFYLYVLLVIFLTICAIIVITSVYFKYFDDAGIMMGKIPSLKGVPIFDNSLDFLLDDEQMFQFLRKCYKQFKGIFGFRGFNYRFVNIYDPKDLEKILKNKNTKRFPYIFLQHWLGSGLVLSKGEKWHLRRKMLTPAFHFNIQKKFLININEHTEQLLEMLQEEVGKENTEILPIVAKTTLQIICGLHLQYSRAGRLLSKIPGPKGLFLIGNTLDLVVRREDLFKLGRDLHFKYGKLSKITGCHIRAVNVYSPEDAEIILSSARYIEKGSTYDFLKPWLGKGLLVNNGEKWHVRRKMLTPSFHFNILKKFTNVFSEETEDILKSLKEETKKEKTDILPLIMKSTIRIMCETSMGTSMREDIHTVVNKYLKAIAVLGECIVYRFSRSWLYVSLAFYCTKVARIQERAVKDLHTFTKKIIQERRKFRKENIIIDRNDDDEMYGKKNRMAMLDLLLEQEKLGNIDEDGIREEVDTFMFEGHDTTSMLLNFMIMRIANEQHVQNLINEEMHRIFGDSDRKPTMDDLSEMKYLECCIKETLRLYPSVPFISRTLTEEVVLSGYTVPVGTQCNIHIFDIHRLSEVYPEPEKFIPERFLAENIINRHPYAYIPFSAGPRNCIGQRFAMLEIKTLMSGLIRRFHLQPVTKPEEITFVGDLVLRPKDPIYVRVCEKNI